jgi:Spy/CpxP family protein refolding chaperone
MRTNRIKIIFATLFSVITMAFSVSAQDKTEASDKYRSHDPEARAKKQTEMMKTQLGLTAEQASKVESINLKYAQKGKEQREAIHKQMKSLREEREKDMTAILTKEQIEKYNKLKEEYKSKRKQDHKGCSKGGMKMKEEKK